MLVILDVNIVLWGMAKKFFRVYDSEGRYLRDLPASELKTGLWDEEYLAGVNCILTQSGEFIFGRRGDGEVAAGWLNICTGKVENDEEPRAALVRELREEFGIPDKISNSGLISIGAFPLFAPKRQYSKFWLTNYFHLDLPQDFLLKPDGQEVIEVLRVPTQRVMSFVRENAEDFMFYDDNVDGMFQIAVDRLRE